MGAGECQGGGWSQGGGAFEGGGVGELRGESGGGEGREVGDASQVIEAP